MPITAHCYGVRWRITVKIDHGVSTSGIPDGYRKSQQTCIADRGGGRAQSYRLPVAWIVRPRPTPVRVGNGINARAPIP